MENLTSQEWQKIYDELYDLREEFLKKWRKNDFKFRTEFNANHKRVSEIVNNSVRIIRGNGELENFMFENEDENYRTYMESSGFWVESVYHNYMFKILDFIESKLE